MFKNLEALSIWKLRRWTSPYSKLLNLSERHNTASESLGAFPTH